MQAEFATGTTSTPGSAVDVVERYPGTGSTDFWGISFAFSGIDQQAMSGEALERELTLMRACWAFFDDVRSRVSAEMQRGPRGGGQDRDRIVRHVIFTEQDWAKKLGVPTSEDAMLTDEGLNAHRDAYRIPKAAKTPAFRHGDTAALRSRCSETVSRHTKALHVVCIR
ncbi:MAG: hypothetical protein M3014_02595 [Chloroflexota bacterium]|nr:hypothetical protein [Chloroflexota bacterium]